MIRCALGARVIAPPSCSPTRACQIASTAEVPCFAVRGDQPIVCHDHLVYIVNPSKAKISHSRAEELVREAVKDVGFSNGTAQQDGAQEDGTCQEDGAPSSVPRTGAGDAGAGSTELVVSVRNHTRGVVLATLFGASEAQLRRLHFWMVARASNFAARGAPAEVKPQKGKDRDGSTWQFVPFEAYGRGQTDTDASGQ